MRIAQKQAEEGRYSFCCDIDRMSFSPARPTIHCRQKSERYRRRYRHLRCEPTLTSDPSHLQGFDAKELSDNTAPWGGVVFVSVRKGID